MYCILLYMICFGDELGLSGWVGVRELDVLVCWSIGYVGGVRE